MSLNLIKVGGLVRIEETGKSNITQPANSLVKIIEHDESGDPNLLKFSFLFADGTYILLTGYAQLSVSGVAATSASDLYVKIATVFPNTNSGSGGTWGTITGTLSDQTDVQAAINAKSTATTLTAVKTSNHTAAANEFVRWDNTSGNLIQTLPTTPADKTIIGAKLTTLSGSNTVTLTAGGSDVFNKTGGSTTLVLTLLNQAILLEYKASEGVWVVLATDAPISNFLPITGGTLTGGLIGTTITGTAFIKSSGTSAQFLKADGSVDANTYLTTSVGASTYLPLAGGTLTGNLLFTDNTYDIGASGATRPRTAYIGTSLFSALIVGGTGTTDTLTFKTTSGVGATGARHIFLVGNNGAIEAVTILNNGFVGIGTNNPNALLRLVKDQNAETGLYITNASTGAAAQSTILVGETASGGKYAYLSFTNNSFTPTGVYRANMGLLEASYTGGLAVGASQASGIITFHTGGSAAINERMRIDSNGLVTVTKTAIGVTPTDSILLTNTTAAALGAQQYSPAIHFTAKGWATTPSTSQSLDFRNYMTAVQGSNNPNGDVIWDVSVNGSAYGTFMKYNTNGGLSIGTNILPANTGTFDLGATSFKWKTGYFSASIGIGITPTAELHLAAGTATAGTAPIKMVAGTRLTTPEAGTIEYETGQFILQSDALLIKGVVTGTAGGGLILGSAAVAGASGAIWSSGVTPSTSNYAFYAATTETDVNAPTSGTIYFNIAGANKWQINSSGHLLAGTDNTYDIGASGATRPRTIYTAADIFIGRDLYIANSRFLNWNGRSAISSPADSNLLITNSAANNFNVLMFGGITSSFPALKRSTTKLQVRLADDSADADLTCGNLTLNTAGNKINITTGSNASAGTATLVGGTVTVNTTAVTASSLIYLTDATTGSLTNIGTPTVGTKTAGTSFVINSSNVLDTSTVNWLIIN